MSLPFAAKGPAGTLASALQTHLSAQKPVIMFGFLGTWQFSSKAVIWLCDGVLCLARAV